MTIVSQIITDAYRQSNLLAIGTSPTTLQFDEGLRYLSRIVKSTRGNEAGELLVPFPIGRMNIQRPSGYPWYDGVPPANWFCPENQRLMCNLQQNATIFLHPKPDNGSGLGVQDIAGNLGTYPLTLNGNGRLIEGQPFIVINEDDANIEWFYRDDIGSWVRITPITIDGEFPFPEAFDDYFITMLAIRLNPSYGTQLDPQSQMVLQRSRTQLRARYFQNIPMHSELALIRPAKVAADRDEWTNGWGLYNPNAMFTSGWPW